MSGVQIIVVAKRPVAGRVKTRLTPPYRPEQAAALARAALADTLGVVARTRAVRRVLALEAFEDPVAPPPTAATPGRPGTPTAGAAASLPGAGPWKRPPGAAGVRPGAAGGGMPASSGVIPQSGAPASFDVIRQRGGGLDERLAHAFADVYAGCRAPMVLIGMDTPQVTPALLDAAATALHTADAVLGPAADGGFWLLGLRRPAPDLLLGVPMSTIHTGAVQRARLLHAGLRLADAPQLRDVDTAEDAAAVAAHAPRSTFAETHATLAASLPPAHTGAGGATATAGVGAGAWSGGPA